VTFNEQVIVATKDTVSQLHACLLFISITLFCTTMIAYVPSY